MPFEEIAKNVLAIFGGVAGIVALAIWGSVKITTERLSKKYDLKLDKELESFKSALSKEQSDFQNALNLKLESLKSTLDRKNYISKTRFDTEFQIYRELSKTFFNMIKSIGNLMTIPEINMGAFIEDEETDKYSEVLKSRSFKKAIKCLFDAGNTLHQNAAFISKDFYEKYNEIFKFCAQQLDTQASSSEKIIMRNQIFIEIENKFLLLNELIREYLFTLDVIE